MSTCEDSPISSTYALTFSPYPPLATFSSIVTISLCSLHASRIACSSIGFTKRERAYDQILHDVCLQNLPVIFAVDRAGLVGSDGVIATTCSSRCPSLHMTVEKISV